MKPPVGLSHAKLSFFKPLVLPILFILPYIFLSSCGDTLTPITNEIQTDNSIECTQGMLKVLVTFDNDSTFFTYAWGTQASRTEIYAVRKNGSVSMILMPGVKTIRITKWLPENFNSRSGSEFICSNSVRYDGATGSWYLENATDTIVKYRNTFGTVVCNEKCQ